MGRKSAGEHDAASLRALGEKLAKIGALFVDLATDYGAEPSLRLSVEREDQRKKAILYLNNFLASARQALDDHQEATGLYKAAAPTATPAVSTASDDRPRRRVVRRGKEAEAG